MTAREPARAARDVAPGERWTFPHRSMAEVMREEDEAPRADVADAKAAG